MRSPLTVGSTNVESVPFVLLDTDGDPYSAALPSDFAIQYRRSDQAAFTTITTVAATLGTPLLSGLASEGDGGYELGIGTAHKASGTWLRIKWTGTGIRPDSTLIQLLPVDLFDEDAAGLDVSQFQATPLDAAGVRAAVGMAAANLDAQIGGLSTLTAAGIRTELSLIHISEPTRPY